MISLSNKFILQDFGDHKPIFVFFYYQKYKYKYKTSDQTAYVKGRYIGESTRLIPVILEISDTNNLKGYFFTADLEKAFDSIEHFCWLRAIPHQLGNDFTQST